MVLDITSTGANGEFRMRQLRAILALRCEVGRAFSPSRKACVFQLELCLVCFKHQIAAAVLNSPTQPLDSGVSKECGRERRMRSEVPGLAVGNGVAVSWFS
jgi:hypothetical protein